MAEARGRGRGRGGSSANPGRLSSNRDERPRKEAILDLSKYVNKQVQVKFTGGKQVIGILKGYDQLLNLVMDDMREVVRDLVTGEALTPLRYRKLGLAVVRGTSLVVLSPLDGSAEISNPFAAEE